MKISNKSTLLSLSILLSLAACQKQENAINTNETQPVVETQFSESKPHVLNLDQLYINSTKLLFNSTCGYSL